MKRAQKSNQGIAIIFIVILLGLAIILTITVVFRSAKRISPATNQQNLAKTTPIPTTPKLTPPITETLSIVTPLDGDTISANPVSIIGYVPYDSAFRIFGGVEEKEFNVKSGSFSFKYKLHPGLNNINLFSENKNTRGKEFIRFSVLYLPGEEI